MPDTPDAPRQRTDSSRENRGNDCVSRQTWHSYRAGSGQSTPGSRTLRYARPAPPAVRTRLPRLTAARRAFSADRLVTQRDVI